MATKAMTGICKITVLAAVVFAGAEAASAADLSVVLTGTFSTPSVSAFSSSLSYASSLGVGAGVLFDFPVNETFSIQEGLLYQTRAFTDSAGNALSLNGIQVPVVGRYRFGFPGFSVLAGPYLTIGINSTVSGVTAGTNYADYSLNTADFGVMAGAAYAVALGGGVSLLADGRYSIGLSNVAAIAPATFRYNDLQFMMGLTFGL